MEDKTVVLYVRGRFGEIVRAKCIDYFNYYEVIDTFGVQLNVDSMNYKKSSRDFYDFDEFELVKKSIAFYDKKIHEDETRIPFYEKLLLEEGRSNKKDISKKIQQYGQRIKNLEGYKQSILDKYRNKMEFLKECAENN